MSTGHLSFCHCKKLLTRPFPASKILSGLHIRKIFPLDSVGRKEHVCLLQTCSLQWPHWPWVTRHLYNFFRHCDKRVLQCKQMSPPGATHHTSPAASTFCVFVKTWVCVVREGGRVSIWPPGKCLPCLIWNKHSNSKSWPDSKKGKGERRPDFFLGHTSVFLSSRLGQSEKCEK